MTMAPMLLLQYSVDLVPKGGHQIVCSVAGPLSISHKEPAGHYFHEFALKQSGFWDEPEAEQAADDTSDQSKESLSRSSSQSFDEQPPPGVEWKGTKKKKKSKRSKEVDMYALLGLQNERWTANEQQIKLAYRKVCLEAHPDKALVGIDDELEKERIENHFKTIQDAYETLSDPAKRREYDSTDDFDDSLPTSCDPKDFFKVFSPAFKRNTRWSVDPKVPDVGTEDTPWEEVEKFYNFWYSFKSWREFPHADEEDVEQAESREHRRWIDRINSKLREKGKKEETKRLREFVEAAYRIDPRVAAKKEADKMERERKKREKEEARRKAQEEAERKKAEEEAEKKLAEEAAKKAAEEGKKAKEAAKRALKRERQRLRGCSAAADGKPRLADEDAVDKLCAKLDTAALGALNDELAKAEGDREAQDLLVRTRLDELEMAEAEEQLQKEAKKRDTEAAMKDMAKRDHSEKMKRMTEWTDEELRMLDKAVSKYPQGTPKRWEQVAAYIRTRPLEEVLLMVKERQGASAARLRQQEDWKGAQKKQAEVKSGLDTRAYAFTDVEVNLTGEAAVKLQAPAPVPMPAAASAKSKAAPAAKANGTPAPATSKAAAPAANGVAAAAVPAKSKAAVEVAAAATNGVAAAAADGGAEQDGKKGVVSSSSGDWNEEQELALVKALKQFGKEVEDRWERISGVVPGKTKAQCFKRFKELRDAFRGKKE